MTAASHPDKSAAGLVADWRELATREGDGLEISLHWSKSTARVRVTVLDKRLGEFRDIHVDPTDALSAFNHPFAYAGSRAVPDEREWRLRGLRRQPTERS
jgi:hypothetical protein